MQTPGSHDHQEINTQMREELEIILKEFENSIEYECLSPKFPLLNSEEVEVLIQYDSCLKWYKGIDG